MKKVIKHILLLSVLLLFGNISIFANTLAATPMLASLANKSISQEKSNQINLEELFLNRSSINNPVFEVYHKKEILTSDNEEEDSETMTSKKNIEKISSYVSFFKQQKTQAFLLSYKKTLTFCKELFYIPSRNLLYIIFEVFRI